MDLISRPRSGQKFLQYVLLFNKSSGSSKVAYLMVDPWKKTRLFPKVNTLSIFPVDDLVGYRAVVLSNCIYVIGGKRWNSGTYVNDVWKYDPISSQWTQCQPMKLARTRFTADVLNERIYCVGGVVSGDKVTERAECYDPVRDEWSEICELPTPRADHASCVVNNRLYISGGIRKLKHKCSAVFLVYDFDIDEWNEPITAIELPQEREKHTMVPIGGRWIFFVAGYEKQREVISGLARILTSLKGRGFDRDNFREKDEAKVSSFDCRKRVLSKLDPCWDKSHPNLFHPRSHAGHIVLGKQIYLIGGRSYSKDEDVRTVEYYDVKRKKWRETFQLPDTGSSYMNIDCCVIKVPTCNRDFNSKDLYLYDKWLLW